MEINNDIEWRIHQEYSKYEVSNTGEVRSVKNRRNLEQFENNSGYNVVCIITNDKHKENKLVHRLVAQTYLDNPNDYKYVSFKDGNKKNINVENLQWVEHFITNNGMKFERHSEFMKSFWTDERKKEHSERMKEIHKLRKENKIE